MEDYTQPDQNFQQTPPPITTPPQAPGQLPPDQIPQDSKTMAMLAHLLGLFTGFLGCLIIWLIKKDQDKFVDDQGKEALNFQITLLICSVAGVVLSFVGIGILILFGVWIYNLIGCILGTIAANKGEYYRYPWAIRLIK